MVVDSLRFPPYIKDLFGTLQVGAIHGRLLTAWSVAGVLGPVLVNYIRELQIARGLPKTEAYSITMYIMVGVLLIGFIANLRLRPVAAKYHQSPLTKSLTVERLRMLKLITVSIAIWVRYLMPAPPNFLSSNSDLSTGIKLNDYRSAYYYYQQNS